MPTLHQDGRMTTWTAPAVHRVTEPRSGDERAMLDGLLDWHRQTLLVKCTGLTAEQLKTPSVGPSDLTLLGLVRHLTDMERSWFRSAAARQAVDDLYSSCDDNPDGDFFDVDTADAEANYAAYLAEVEQVRHAVAGLSLDLEYRRSKLPPISLRWIYLHMIQEYARHNGHADSLRQRIDGGWGV